MRKSGLKNPSFFLHRVTKHLEKHPRVEVWYVDFSKAFDPANQNQLQHKTKAVGITRISSARRNGFLRERTFSVRVGGYRKSHSDTPSGIPQAGQQNPHAFHIRGYLAKTMCSPR